MLIKIHRSYRTVVAICDSNLIGNKFEEGKKQLELKEHFFKGDETDKKNAVKILQRQALEDATFNIVGKEAIETAIEAKIIDENNVSYVDNIPFSLVLI